MTTVGNPYEEVATDLLNQFAKEFGLDCVEGKQSISGYRSETTPGETKGEILAFTFDKTITGPF